MGTGEEFLEKKQAEDKCDLNISELKFNGSVKWQSQWGLVDLMNFITDTHSQASARSPSTHNFLFKA